MGAQTSSNFASAQATAKVESNGSFDWGPEGLDDHATLRAKIRMEPGMAYLLRVDFADPKAIKGVLQITGRHFFREYGLPTYGGSRSFGAGGLHRNLIPLWTTAGTEDLEIKFYPSFPKSGKPGVPVGSATFLRYEHLVLPVKVDSWMPYRATVRSAASGWLETPRMFQTSYQATVNGMPALVRKSPDSLVAVQIPVGSSEVELAYRAPLGLRFLFWLSFISASVVIAGGFVSWILHLLRSPSPAKASVSASSA
jgi:hypothetical protein